MSFHFEFKEGFERDTILFAKIDEIFKFNFVTQIHETIYKFKTPLKMQPQFFLPNDNQDIFIIASPDDGIYLNINEDAEVDIDNEYQIANIKQIIYDNEDDVFYVLCNKYEEKLGFFVLKIRENDPYNSRFLIKWKNKLDIGDASIFVLRTSGSRGSNIKEIIISFKTIFINTYNIVVMDISSENEKNLIFRHEGF